MPRTLEGDLLRILAHGAISSGGNLLTHAVLQPMLAKQQLEKGEKLENYKMLVNSAALAEKPEELAAIDAAMKKIGGPGLVQLGGGTTEQQGGPIKNLVQKFLPGLTPPTPTAEPQAQAQFLQPQKSLDQMLAAAVKKNPEIAQSLVGLKYGMQPKAGELLKDAAAARKQEGTERYQQGMLELGQMNAQTRQMLVALHAQTAMSTAQYRSQVLKLMGQKVENVAEKAALDGVQKANEDYLKILTVGGKQEAKTAAADQFNSRRRQVIQKFPQLEESLPPEIPIGEVDVSHWFGLGTPTSERRVLKPGEIPSEGTAEAGEKPKTRPKATTSPGKTFIIYEGGDPNKPRTVDQETYNKVKAQEGK